MYLQIYYFTFPLNNKYKEQTMIESISFDLNKFFIYYFWTNFSNYIKTDKIEANLFINKENNIILPKLIFEINWNLDDKQLKSLLEIFSEHWSENFIIETNLDKKLIKNFLQIDNIEKILNKANKNFTKFIENYKKNKVIDKTDENYIEFRKSYNLLIFLYYFLIKNYNQISKVKEHINWMNINLQEYIAHKELLKNRLEINQENLEKIIVIYSNFIEKILKILEKIK
jgi:hypothetical protein